MISNLTFNVKTKNKSIECSTDVQKYAIKVFLNWRKNSFNVFHAAFFFNRMLSQKFNQFKDVN